MGRRQELENEIAVVKKRLDNASADIPRYIIEAWRKEFDSLSFELNNLYDDEENQDS